MDIVGVITTGDVMDEMRDLMLEMWRLMVWDGVTCGAYGPCLRIQRRMLSLGMDIPLDLRIPEDEEVE